MKGPTKSVRVEFPDLTTHFEPLSPRVFIDDELVACDLEVTFKRGEVQVVEALKLKVKA